MNTKGTSDIVMDNVVYSILLVIFIATISAFVYSKMNGASIWEDFYAKEIVKVIDLAKLGDDIALDVQKAIEIAAKNKISDFNEIFKFDNVNNEVCVKLSTSGGSCFNYFNKVSVTYDSSGKWVHLAEPVNRLHFLIIEKREVSV